MTKGQLRYLHLVAVDLIEDDEDEAFARHDERHALWQRMTEQQKEQTNEAYEAIFGQWV